MRQRDAARTAQRFIAKHYSSYGHWNFDLCLEREDHRGKMWSFGLTPDEEDADYAPGRGFVGYVHADGIVEGLY